MIRLTSAFLISVTKLLSRFRFALAVLAMFRVNLMISEFGYLAAAISDCHAVALLSSGNQLRLPCDDSTSRAREIAPVVWSPSHPSVFTKD